MKQTPICVLCDWLISNSTSKDDIERWMSKDSRYARNTERGYKMDCAVILSVKEIDLNQIERYVWREENSEKKNLSSQMGFDRPYTSWL